MRSLLYPKLALQNIRKNRRFYSPYLLAGIFTVAMFYDILFLATNSELSNMPGADALQSLMVFGTVIIGIFSAIFLFYTNSFLMKRRQKEIGLFNILGMEKQHIGLILFWETVYTYLFTVVLGTLLGILISKLLLLILYKVLFFQVKFGFSVSLLSAGIGALVFAGIYLLALLFNLGRLHLSRPVELLSGGNAGEREPKSRWLLAALGIACMGAGYWIANTVDSPLKALSLFFLAVLLVIIGTYLLFTAVSISVLKLLRKNKNYYYRPEHFASVSGMLYRMKQNAVGLANICILSTMVLVMVSTSVCLYTGVKNVVQQNYPYDLSVSGSAGGALTDSLEQTIRDRAAAAGLSAENSFSYTCWDASGTLSGNSVTDSGGVGSRGYTTLVLMTKAQYESLSGVSLPLSDGKTALYCSAGSKGWSDVTLFGVTFPVETWLDRTPVTFTSNNWGDLFLIVVPDENALETIHAAKSGENAPAGDFTTRYFVLNLSGTDNEILNWYSAADASGLFSAVFCQCRQEVYQQFYSLYGGFLFLCIFLALLFVMATALIMYYKQVSEGYADKERYEIMRKVGMSRAEVRSSIRGQILLVFFLPLAVAVIHLAGAFRIISRMLLIFGLTDIPLFAVCALITIAAFSAVYGGMYSLTARTYSGIVGG